jgi:hypothetical protein
MEPSEREYDQDVRLLKRGLGYSLIKYVNNVALASRKKEHYDGSQMQVAA